MVAASCVFGSLCNRVNLLQTPSPFELEPMKSALANTFATRRAKCPCPMGSPLMCEARDGDCDAQFCEAIPSLYVEMLYRVYIAHMGYGFRRVD